MTHARSALRSSQACTRCSRACQALLCPQTRHIRQSLSASAYGLKASLSEFSAACGCLVAMSCQSLAVIPCGDVGVLFFFWGSFSSRARGPVLTSARRGGQPSGLVGSCLLSNSRPRVKRPGSLRLSLRRQKIEAVQSQRCRVLVYTGGGMRSATQSVFLCCALPLRASLFD